MYIMLNHDCDDIGALTNRQRGATVTTVAPMKELLRRKDSDYYRSVQLLIADAELQQLCQWRVDVERRSKIPLGMCRPPRNYIATPSTVRTAPGAAYLLHSRRRSMNDSRAGHVRYQRSLS
jgi:hypothetical protein